MKRKRFLDTRLWIQIAFAAVTNGYINGFIQSKIYTGPSKALCVPGLNCYSCPGALASCPIGALQAVLCSRDYRFSFYIVGFLTTVGALCGRLVCGFLCPFGLLQDLLYKIPCPRKRKSLPGERYFKYLKYAVLLLFVILLPALAVNMVGQGDPWFCKWICPSGTFFAGLPLVLGSQVLREAAGWLFGWKMLLLCVLLLLSVLSFRPFCKFLCPLGAIYGFFNPISLYRYRADEALCTHCSACQKACPMGLVPYKTPNHPECIRCMACVKSCPVGALVAPTFGKSKPACGGCQKPNGSTQ